MKCTHCATPSAPFACSRCRMPYCGVACQRASHRIGTCTPYTPWQQAVEEGNNVKLKELNATRKRVVDGLLRDAIKAANCTASTCTFNSVGSTSLTSDYDVTVSGPNAAAIVDYFNSEFRKTYCAESSEVFDTNVYGTEFTDATPTENPARQRMWALHKLHLYVPGEGMPYNASMDRNNHRAMNIKYVQELYRAQSEGTDDARSRANYYARDAYFTRGAFLHVVRRRQGKDTNVVITRDEYEDSAIENVAEAIRYFEKTASIDAASKYIARATDAVIRAHGAATPPHVRKVNAAAEVVRTQVRAKPNAPSAGEKRATLVALMGGMGNVQKYLLALIRPYIKSL